MITGGMNENSSQGRRWEEKDIETLGQRKEDLQKQLGELQKARRKVAHDDHLTLEISALESKFAQLQDEKEAAEMKQKSIDTELAHFAQLMTEIQQQVEAKREPLAEVEEEISQVQETIIECENQAFGSFCAEIGVSTIREYQQGTLMYLQKANQKKVEYVTAKAKLESAIRFEQQRLDEATQRIEKFKAEMEKVEQARVETEAEKQNLKEKHSGIQAEMDRMGDHLNQLKHKLNEASNALMEQKKLLSNFLTSFDMSNKQKARKEQEIEKIVSEKLSILRKCKLEEINLPLKNGSTLESIALEALDDPSLNSDMMDVDGVGSSERADVILLDFSKLGKALMKNGSSEQEKELEVKIRDISAEIDRMAPNVRSVNNMAEAERKFKETAVEFDQSRKEAKIARDAFLNVKQERVERFNRTFEKISDSIDRIYKELTQSKSFPTGGTAYLSVEDADEPYLDGIKYHAMPPMKRFREMELLSGGEKTMAALALIFAIHQAQPSPFFVLDEVDAALDTTNVNRMTQYIEKHCQDVQFIVISLKSAFYEHAHALVGIYRDQDLNTSQTLTLDLTKYPQ